MGPTVNRRLLGALPRRGVLTHFYYKYCKKCVSIVEKDYLTQLVADGKSIRQISKIVKLTKERAVDVMITRLRQKIEPDPKNPKYLQTVRGNGYVLWTD